MVLKVDTFQLGMYAGIVKSHHQDAAAARGWSSGRTRCGRRPSSAPSGRSAPPCGCGATGRGEVILLGLLTLGQLIGAGAPAKVATGIAR